MSAGNKAGVKVTALIDADLVTWIDSMVERKVFKNRSHGFELAVEVLRRHPELILEIMEGMQKAKR